MNLWGQRRERGEFTRPASNAELLADALKAQDDGCARIGAILAAGYGRVTPEMIAVCVIDPTGVDGYTGEPAVRWDMDAAMERVSAAVLESAREAHIVQYDGTLRINGSGGESVLDQFPPMSDKASERRYSDDA